MPKPRPQPLLSARQRASAAYARTVRFGTPEQIAKARTDLNEARVQAWLEKTLAEAPPHLTPSTQAKLARLLTEDES
jgi:hypothetical protein